MREFELAFEEGLKHGLRPTRKIPRNTQTLVECYNVKPFPLGPVPYEPMTDPFAALFLVTEGSFPQPLMGSRYSFLIERDSAVGEDRVWQINADLSLTFLIPIPHATYTPGDRYDMADFGDYVLISSESVMIYRDTTTTLMVATAALATLPRFKTICNFKGQAIGGNVQSAWHGCGANSIIWSKIGDIDFTPGRRNEAGFRELHWKGEVYKVRRLGDQVIVYGSEGVASLTPVVDPAPTFKFDELTYFGLAGVNAVGGDYDVHVFVDSAGWLWRIKKGGKPDRLGYQEYMALMAPESIIVSYDPNEQDFYISDGEYGFILTPYGLAQIHQLPSNVFFVGGQLYGMFSDNGDKEFRLTTDVIDFGFRPRKTLFTTEVGIDSSSDVQVAIDWRADKANPFTRTSWVPMNELGISTQIISGVDFRLCLKASSYSDINLDYIKQRWKMTDLRSIRGVYAPPPRGPSAGSIIT